jgi:ferrous-iron efflux pump FieF
MGHHHAAGSDKQHLLVRSLAIAGGLAALKVGVFLATDSMAILASAADSLMDFVVSLANFVFVRSAEKPADEKHAYGHGKIESLAGLLQSVVVGGVTLAVAGMAISRFSSPREISEPLAGAGVTAVALILSLWHIRNLNRSAIETGSQVMRSEYVHYASDILAYMGVIASFLLSRATGAQFWDPLVSLLIVAYLLKSVASIFNDSLKELLDEQLPRSERTSLDELIRGFDPRIVEYHNLRTRKVGATRFIEFHVVLRDITLFNEAHDITERLIARIRQAYPDAELTVHADPEEAVLASRAAKRPNH